MNEISTRSIHLLPKAVELRRICKAISALEAILCQDWAYRCYSYQKDWGTHEEICEMRNGQGDQMLILFSTEDVCINGFAHEYATNASKELEGLPTIFHEFIDAEPVKSIGTTFCIWQIGVDEEWKVAFTKEEQEDGSKDLLQLLDGNPLTYQKWAEEYYEIELKQELVEAVFYGTEITESLVRQLNPTLESFETLKSDLNEIGY